MIQNTKTFKLADDTRKLKEVKNEAYELYQKYEAIVEQLREKIDAEKEKIPNIDDLKTSDDFEQYDKLHEAYRELWKIWEMYTQIDYYVFRIAYCERRSQKMLSDLRLELYEAEEAGLEIF